MPASKKNKENLRKAVSQAYEGSNAQKRIKKIAKKYSSNGSSVSTSTPSKPVVKKSREENRAAVQRTLKLLRKQKSK